MSNVATLNTCWRNGKTLLTQLINDRGDGARLFCRDVLSSTDNQAKGTTTVELKPPICIYNAPQKGASKRTGRQAIFIGGSMEISGGTDKPALVGARCYVKIYDCKEEANKSVKLTFVESIHFDMDSDKNRMPFHPIFHAQRGPIDELSVEIVKDIIEECRHIPREAIEVPDDQRNGSPYLRLPTPQLDFLSVVTIVAADYFCDKKDQSSSKRRFKAILDWLVSPKNIVSQGRASRALMDLCTAHNSMSTGYWYPELS